MKLKERPLKFGAKLKENHNTPAFDWSSMELATLISVDQPMPAGGSSLVVTINVQHAEHSQPVAANLAVCDAETQERLYKTLLSYVGRTLSEIGESDFDLR